MTKQATKSQFSKRAKFFDLQGNPISYEDWNKLNESRADNESLRIYFNGKINVALRWIGFINEPDSLLQEYWGVFKVIVQDYVDGKPVGLPNIKNYRHRKDAESEYEKILALWTDSNFVVDPVTGQSKLCEVGNLLAPVSKDKPIEINEGAGSGSDSVYGSW